MTPHILLVTSLLLNALLAAILWRFWQWRRQTLSMLHALLRMIQKNSGAIRRVQFEPWRDEYVEEAVNAVDAQFSVVFAVLHPDEDQFVIHDDPVPAVIPREPGTDDL